MQEPLHYVLALYIWPFWLFRDATLGTSLERWAAYRHNRAQRVHLPVYAWRWSVVSGLFAGAVLAMEVAAKSDPGSAVWRISLIVGALCFVASLTVLLVILAGYLYLGRAEN